MSFRIEIKGGAHAIIFRVCYQKNPPRIIINKCYLGFKNFSRIDSVILKFFIFKHLSPKRAGERHGSGFRTWFIGTMRSSLDPPSLTKHHPFNIIRTARLGVQTLTFIWEEQRGENEINSIRDDHSLRPYGGDGVCRRCRQG
jgi:hypothetical protein